MYTLVTFAVRVSSLVLPGIVPFGCLFIEMYFILSAVWSHNKIYYVYGFMFAILVLLCLVIICVSITCTYILLNAEDYRWQWQSYISCAATALYVFLYTIHYFYNSTQMSRAQQRQLASHWSVSFVKPFITQSFWSFCRLGERELRSGFLQTVYYFGTSFNFCIGLALFCGSLGFIGASKFVFLIYSNIKAEWSWVSEGNALRTPKQWCMQTWNREWHYTQLQLSNLLAIEEKRSARLSKEVVMRDRLDCLQVWC